MEPGELICSVKRSKLARRGCVILDCRGSQTPSEPVKTVASGWKGGFHPIAKEKGLKCQINRTAHGARGNIILKVKVAMNVILTGMIMIVVAPQVGKGVPIGIATPTTSMAAAVTVQMLNRTDRVIGNGVEIMGGAVPVGTKAMDRIDKVAQSGIKGMDTVARNGIDLLTGIVGAEMLNSMDGVVRTIP